MLEAAGLCPNAWWWLKGDGTDLNPGLSESMRMVWSGDVDLNDHKLQQAYDQYKQELGFIAGLGLKERLRPDLICEDMAAIRYNLLRDIEFTQSG